MKRVWWAFGLATGAVVVWLAGLVAVGIWSEDVCMAEGIPGASGYTQSVRVWPPALLCEYTGGETVLHTTRGLMIVGWTYAVPTFIAAGLLTWGLTGHERPTINRVDRTSGGR